MEAYRIKAWAELFETAESRKRLSLSWVAIPNKHDGKGYRRLMREHGPDVYGAWVLIAAVASKCPVRGVLADLDGPLTAEDIADKTDCPVVAIKAALEACSNDRIGWLEKVSLPEHSQIEAKSADIAAASAGPPASHAGPSGLPDQTRPDQTLQNQTPGGVGVLSSGSGKGSGGVFAKLTKEHLADDAVLENWFCFASVKASRPLFANSETNRLNVFAAAERALEVGDDPVKLFKHIVGKSQWNLLTNEQEERARKRLLRLRRAS